MTTPEFVTETVRLLDKQLVGLHQNAEHGPMLLAWMLFNMQGITGEVDDDELTLRYRQFGTRATHLGVFSYLHQMISHIMFKVNRFLILWLKMFFKILHVTTSISESILKETHTISVILLT